MESYTYYTFNLFHLVDLTCILFISLSFYILVIKRCVTCEMLVLGSKNMFVVLRSQIGTHRLCHIAMTLRHSDCITDDIKVCNKGSYVYFMCFIVSKNEIYC